MSKLEVIDSHVNDYYDVVIEIGFKEPLKPIEIVSVLKIVTETISEQIIQDIFDGFSSFKISHKSLSVSFRFLIGKEEIYQGEEINRLQTQLFLYFFAKIDAHYELGTFHFILIFVNL